MGRKKRVSEANFKLPQLTDGSDTADHQDETELIDTDVALEDEQVEALAVAEVDESKKSDMEDVAEEEEVEASSDDTPKPKPRKKRKPRKQKSRPAPKAQRNRARTAAKVKNEEAEAEVEADVVAKAVSDSKPPRKRARRATKKVGKEMNELTEVTQDPERAPESSVGDDSLREEVAITSVAMHKSMEGMAKQWGTIKEITEQVSSHLEKVSGSIKVLNQSYVQTLDKTEKQDPSKPGLFTKIALGASAASIFLSLVSFSFSHSLRRKVFSSELAKATIEAAEVQAQATVIPLPVAPRDVTPSELRPKDVTSSTPRQKEIAAGMWRGQRSNSLPTLNFNRNPKDKSSIIRRPRSTKKTPKS